MNWYSKSTDVAKPCGISKSTLCRKTVLKRGRGHIKESLCCLNRNVICCWGETWRVAKVLHSEVGKVVGDKDIKKYCQPPRTI